MKSTNDTLPMARAVADLYPTPASQGQLTRPWGRHLSALVVGTNEAEIINSRVAYVRVLERVVDGRFLSEDFPALGNPVVKQYLEDVRCALRGPYPIEALALALAKYRLLRANQDQEA